MKLSGILKCHLKMSTENTSLFKYRVFYHCGVKQMKIDYYCNNFKFFKYLIDKHFTGLE